MRKILLVTKITIILTCASYAAAWLFVNGVSEKDLIFGISGYHPEGTFQQSSCSLDRDDPLSTETRTSSKSTDSNSSITSSVVNSEVSAVAQGAGSVAKASSSIKIINGEVTYENTGDNCSTTITSEGDKIIVSSVVMSSSNGSDCGYGASANASTNITPNANNDYNSSNPDGCVGGNTKNTRNTATGNIPRQTSSNRGANFPSSIKKAAELLPNPTPKVQGTALNIDVNIMPSSINLRSDGKLRVIIMSNPAFNASTIMPSSIKLAGASIDSTRGQSRDMNHDGLPDLAVYFNIEDLSLQPGVHEVYISGRTTDGKEFKVYKTIQVINSGR